MPLDKTQPYGEIYGDADGRHYFQDGAYFDAQGKEIGAKPAKPGRQAKPAEQQAPAAPEDTASQVTSQLGDALA
ncbi:MAG: hypothetical protein PHI64_12685 [Zoogloea sp.]|uniref:hypothetical protein n=1 Tax=Zoogloea sp. TaxID=49181 RepID=UPI0026247B19|nr:hypothetical protein [Zoogloea sp.]MDD2989805.1 hypothetical protein [Zoogloea sp.]